MNSGANFLLEMRVHEALDVLELCEESVDVMRKAYAASGARSVPALQHHDPTTELEASSSSNSIDGQLDQVVHRLQELSRKLFDLQQQQHQQSAQRLPDDSPSKRSAVVEFKSQLEEYTVPVIASKNPQDSVSIEVETSEGTILSSPQGGASIVAVDPPIPILVGCFPSSKHSALLGRSDDSSAKSSPRHLSAIAKSCSSLGESQNFVPLAPDQSSKFTMTTTVRLASTAQQTEEETKSTSVPEYLRNLNEDCELYIAALERRWSPQEQTQLRFRTVV